MMRDVMDISKNIFLIRKVMCQGIALLLPAYGSCASTDNIFFSCAGVSDEPAPEKN
jgi:hypothetical protein